MAYPKSYESKEEAVGLTNLYGLAAAFPPLSATGKDFFYCANKCGKKLSTYGTCSKKCKDQSVRKLLREAKRREQEEKKFLARKVKDLTVRELQEILEKY